MFSTLRPDAAEAIGNIGKDVKLIIKDRSIIHAARNRRAPDGSPADVNLSINVMKSIPRKIADPVAICKDNSSGNLVFRYSLNKKSDVKGIFLPGNGLTSMVLHTFFRRKQKRNRQ